MGIIKIDLLQPWDQHDKEMNYLFSHFEISSSQISLIDLKNVLLPSNVSQDEEAGPIQIKFSGLNVFNNALQGKASLVQINGVSY